MLPSSLNAYTDPARLLERQDGESVRLRPASRIRERPGTRKEVARIEQRSLGELRQVRQPRNRSRHGVIPGTCSLPTRAHVSSIRFAGS